MSVLLGLTEASVRKVLPFRAIGRLDKLHCQGSKYYIDSSDHIYAKLYIAIPCGFAWIRYVDLVNVLYRYLHVFSIICQYLY